MEEISWVGGKSHHGLFLLRWSANLYGWPIFFPLSKSPDWLADFREKKKLIRQCYWSVVKDDFCDPKQQINKYLSANFFPRTIPAGISSGKQIRGFWNNIFACNEKNGKIVIWLFFTLDLTRYSCYGLLFFCFILARLIVLNHFSVEDICPILLKRGNNILSCMLWFHNSKYSCVDTKNKIVENEFKQCF